MQTVLDVPNEVIVYSCWYGYSQCEPMYTIVGTDRTAVEKAVQAAMDEEEERSKEQCNIDHTEEDPEEECPWCNPRIVWSGTIWQETLEAMSEYCGVDQEDMDSILSGEVTYLSHG